VSADQDVSRQRASSTLRRATSLLATISGREEYTDPGEKFENITLLLFSPRAKVTLSRRSSSSIPARAVR
jgi:hypothetical protein